MILKLQKENPLNHLLSLILNKIRLKILTLINKSETIKRLYYQASKSMLDIIVGNELVMQKKINLSIQMYILNILKKFDFRNFFLGFEEENRFISFHSKKKGVWCAFDEPKEFYRYL